MVRVLKFTFIWILALGLGPALAEDWAEYQSEHVLLYSNAGKDHARGLVEDLEVFRSYLIRITNVDEAFIVAKKETDSDPKFLVFGTKNRAWFKTLTGLEDSSISFLHPRGQVTFVDFGYHPDPFEGKAGKAGREALFYEYAKYFLGQYSGFNYPLWYIQGLAMYLSTFEVEEGVAKVGLAPLRTARLLGSALSHHLIPIQYMLGSTREYARGITGLGKDIDLALIEQRGNFAFENNQFTYSHNHSGIFNPETQIRIFKHQAWGIVHYLQSSASRRQNLVTYLQRIAAGENFETSFKDIFGQSIEDFHQAVYDYTERKLFPSLDLEFEGLEITPSVKVRSLDQNEAAFTEVWAKSFLLFQGKRLFAIQNQLEGIGGGFEIQAEILVAEIDFFTGKPGKAKERIGEVLRYEPGNGRALGLMGAILVGEGAIDEARSYLRRAVRADQNDLVALTYLGRSYLLGDGGAIEEGVGVVSRVVALTPQNERARLELAALDDMAGFGEEAKIALENLAFWGSNAPLRDLAEDCLSAIQAGRTCNPLAGADPRRADARP